MNQNTWHDLLITNRDITLDPAGIPMYVQDRQSITQDVVHMIRESGLLTQLIAERSRSKRDARITELQVLVEDDFRIVPGTVVIDWNTNQEIMLFAQSVMGSITAPLSTPDITGESLL